jgi:hypothetical protein
MLRLPGGELVGLWPSEAQAAQRSGHREGRL